MMLFLLDVRVFVLLLLPNVFCTGIRGGYLSYDKWRFYSERIFVPVGLKHQVRSSSIEDDNIVYNDILPLEARDMDFRHIWYQPKAPFHLDILDGVLDGVFSFLPYRYPTKIILISQGVDEDHPEVQGRVSGCSFNHEGTLVKNLTLPNRAYWLEHGTQVASLINGLICGVSKSTEIISMSLGGHDHRISGKRITEALDYILQVSDSTPHELKLIVLADYYYVEGEPFETTMIKRLKENNALFIAHASMVDLSLLSKELDVNDVFLFVSGMYRNGTSMGFCQLYDQAVDMFVLTEDIFLPFTNATAAPMGYGFRSHTDLSVGIAAGIAAYEWATDETIIRASQLKAKLLGRRTSIKGGKTNAFISL
jgi:hypothetical protein